MGHGRATSRATWCAACRDGFTINLEINGVGYRAAVQRQEPEAAARLQPRRRGSDPGRHPDQGEKPTEIEITGADEQKVGQLAAEIRSLRPPEPYKGKGIKYSTETIRRKEGKKK